MLPQNRRATTFLQFKHTTLINDTPAVKFLENPFIVSLSPTAGPNKSRCGIPGPTRLGLSLFQAHPFIMFKDQTEPRKKILIVDDDPVILKTLSFTLKAHGYDVVTATDGSEAIGQVRDRVPDVLLVDVGLAPDVALPWDGFQVAEWIRRISGKVPTIVISGAAKAEYAEWAVGHGAQGFLVKPIDTGLLLDSIAAALAARAPAAVCK